MSLLFVRMVPFLSFTAVVCFGLSLQSFLVKVYRVPILFVYCVFCLHCCFFCPCSFISLYLLLHFCLSCNIPLLSSPSAFQILFPLTFALYLPLIYKFPWSFTYPWFTLCFLKPENFLCSDVISLYQYPVFHFKFIFQFYTIFLLWWS